MLLFFDGFEGYTDGLDVLAVRHPLITDIRYSYLSVGAFGRGGRSGIAIASHYPGRYVRYMLADNYTSFVFGIAAWLNEAGGVSENAGGTFLSFRDDTDQQIGLSLTAAGEIAVYSGTNLLGTTTGAGMTLQTWRYLEIKFTIHASAGSLVIRSNENVVLSLSGIDTQESANAYFNSIMISATYNNKDMYFGDMYWCDLTGSKNNDFLGDVRVDVVRPDSAGANTDFTPSAGANFENVDETPGPDDDTTYNDGAAAGDKDTYNLGVLASPPAGAIIHGVKTVITARKTDAGNMKCAQLTRSGATENLSPVLALSDSFLTVCKVHENNPDDAAVWEDGDINALQVGVLITSLTTTTSTTSTTTTT